MQQLSGSTAVVTGAASGIGRAVAMRLARAGMAVVAADVERPPLDETVAAIEAAGGRAVAAETDVSSWDSVQALRTTTEDTFGPADVVMNNAGVAGTGSVVEASIETWQWTLGVNLFGVIHGMKAFVPGMVDRGRGHVINTSSIAGHMTSSSMGPYCASKHAVAAISEVLHQEMLEGETGVGVTCLCPGFVATGIIGSERNRPERLRHASEEAMSTEMEAVIADAYAAQLDPNLVADMVHDAIVDDRFWLFTDDLADESIRARHADIESRSDPTRRPHLIELILG